MGLLDELFEEARTKKAEQEAIKHKESLGVNASDGLRLKQMIDKDYPFEVEGGASKRVKAGLDILKKNPRLLAVVVNILAVVELTNERYSQALADPKLRLVFGLEKDSDVKEYKSVLGKVQMSEIGLIMEKYISGEFTVE